MKSSFRHVHTDHQFMPNRPTKEFERKRNTDRKSMKAEKIPIRRKTLLRHVHNDHLIMPSRLSIEPERKNINASKSLRYVHNNYQVIPKRPSKEFERKKNNNTKSSFGNVHNSNQVVPNRPNQELERKNTKRREADKNPIYTRDIVTEVHNILKHSTWDSAREELDRLPIKWDSFTVNRVLKTHPPMEKAWLFFNWASGLKGFKHDRFTYTTMLDIFGEAGRVSSMKKVFKQMVERGIKVDVVSCTSLMHWVSESGDVDGAMRVWEELKRNCDPTIVSYTAYMKILLRNDRAQEALEAYAEMTGSGITPNCYTYTVLMDYLIESGKTKEALDVFYEMQGAKVYPDKAACNILVEKLSKLGDTQTMSKILKYMRKNTIVLRYPVFLKALEAVKAARKSDILLRQVNRHCSIQSHVKAVKPLTPDEELISTLVKKENLIASDSLLTEIADKNIKLNPEIVSKIIEVNCERHRDGEALRAFEYSVKMGTPMPKSSYLALLGILVRLDSFSKIVEVTEEMVKAQHSLGIYLASILIRKLGRARKPHLASRVFELLPRDQRCSATYTALIGAHFSVKSVEKGLEVFREMRSLGVAPSLGTYDLMLDGLSKSGRVSEREFRKEKLNLRSDRDNSQHIMIPFEQKVCDLLYQDKPAVL